MSEDCCHEITVVQTVNQITVIEQPSHQIIVSEVVEGTTTEQTVTQIIVNAAPPTQIIIQEPGPKGDPGTPGTGGGGGSTTETAIAGETISVYSAIVVIDGLAYKADPTNIEHVNRVVGVAIQSATSGNSINYRSIGDVSGGSVNDNANYFVGANGQLSTLPVQENFVWHQRIGIGKTESVLAVLIGPAIIL